MCRVISAIEANFKEGDESISKLGRIFAFVDPDDYNFGTR